MQCVYTQNTHILPFSAEITALFSPDCLPHCPLMITHNRYSLVCDWVTVARASSKQQTSVPSHFSTNPMCYNTFSQLKRNPRRQVKGGRLDISLGSTVDVLHSWPPCQASPPGSPLKLHISGQWWWAPPPPDKLFRLLVRTEEKILLCNTQSMH